MDSIFGKEVAVLQKGNQFYRFFKSVKDNTIVGELKVQTCFQTNFFKGVTTENGNNFYKNLLSEGYRKVA